MKNIILYFFSMILSSALFANGGKISRTDYQPKVYWGWHLNVFYPRVAPADFGLSYNQHIKKDLFWVLNYRMVVAKAKTAPTDYKEFGIINLFPNPGFNEVMHTFNLRFGKAYKLFDKINIVSEIGPSYGYYTEKIVTTKNIFQYATHDFENRYHHLLGLSIRNATFLVDSKKVRLETFLYHNINTRFSYTALGLQFGFKRNNLKP